MRKFIIVTSILFLLTNTAHGLLGIFGTEEKPCYIYKDGILIDKNDKNISSEYYVKLHIEQNFTAKINKGKTFSYSSISWQQIKPASPRGEFTRLSYNETHFLTPKVSKDTDFKIKVTMTEKSSMTVLCEETILITVNKPEAKKTWGDALQVYRDIIKPSGEQPEQPKKDWWRFW